MKHPLLPIAALLLAPLAVLHAAETPAKKPNILLIVADDLGYGELSCQGNPQIPTPHIDSLAANGMRFTSGYVTAPVCSPSRAALMTGRYQTRFGQEFLTLGKLNLDPKRGLPLSEVTLADRLKSAGYATALVGKWHLGAAADFHPQKRGFDEFFGFLNEGHTYAQASYPGLISHLRANEPPYDESNPLLRGTQETTEPEYLTEAFTRESVAFIQKNKAQPFFLYLAYNAIHSPMQCSPKYFDRFRHIEDVHRRVFAAMLAAMDDSVGAVLAELRDAGLENDTLIFFISDNGGPTLELTSSNQPLRGGKGSLFDGGIRLPWMAQWKGRIPAGKVEASPVISLDIMPTALAAAGLKIPDDAKLDGVNLLPLLTGGSSGSPHKALFWRYGKQRAVRMGDWKLTDPGQGAQLFNLAKDIGEKTDLAAKEPEKLKELEAAWQEWNKQNIEPKWSGGAQKKKTAP